MKHIFQLAALVLLSLTVSQAHAALQVGDDVKLTVIRQDATNLTGGGGPFRLDYYTDSRLNQKSDGTDNGAADASGFVTTHPESPVDSFLSFCVEINEHFSSGSFYDVRSITGGSIGTARTLSGYAAWVYETFSDNVTLNNVGSIAAADLANYQRAIWAGMSGTLGQTPGTAGSEFLVNVDSAAFNALGIGYTQNFLSAANKLAWANDANATAATMLATLNGYKVLNLQSDIGGNAQDQIIVKQSSAGIVPEPTSLAVWSILGGAAAGIAAHKRRRRLPTGRWSDRNRESILSIIDSGDRV